MLLSKISEQINATTALRTQSFEFIVQISFNYCGNSFSLKFASWVLVSTVYR